MTKEYSTLEYLYENCGRKDFIVGNEKKSFGKKYFTFSRYYSFVFLSSNFYQQITKETSKPNFLRHEVVSKFTEYRKVAFDIDAEGVDESTYQAIIDSLVKALQEVINIDVEKEIIMCTSHGENKFSAHLILLCFVRRDSRDLEYIYEQVKERMHPDLYKYIDHSLSRFTHNLRLLGSSKEGRTKVYNPVWKFKDQLITTQIPEYYPDLDNGPDRRFINWFTTYEDTPSISPLRILRATFLTIVDGCRYINFNLPEKPKPTSQKVENLDEEKIWSALLKKCEGYDEQFQLRHNGDSAFIILERIQPGRCAICERDHDKSDSFIFFKGKEESVLLGCYRANKQYIKLTCLKPELKEAYDERDDEIHEGEIVKDKMYVEKLTDTDNIQCIRAPMAMGKTYALRKFIKSLPLDKRICVLSSRISYSDSADGGFEEIGVKFNHYKQENKDKLYKCPRLIIQVDSLYKIGAENNADNKGGEYDILVLDECSSLLKQFFSSTMDEHRLINAIVFERLVRTTKKIVLMDAFLKPRHLDAIRYLRPHDNIKVTQYIHPNPIKRKCLMYVPEERVKGEGQDLVSDRQALINKIVAMAKEGKKIYVPSFSKNFVKDLGHAMEENGMWDKFQDYTADTDDRTKREDMKNVAKAWKKYQVVAATATVGAGIDFSEKHFDATFAIFGRSCTVEDQMQLIHRVRHTNTNTLYAWIDKPGKGEKKIPTKKQIRKELNRKHRMGKQMSPALLSMTPWLKDLYVADLQDMYRTTRNLKKEVMLALEREHYDVTDVILKRTPDMREYVHPVPDYGSIRELNKEEKKDIEMNIINGEATYEEKLALRRNNLKNYVFVDKMPEEEVDLLWEACERNKNVRPILRNASLEAGKVSLVDLQWADYKKHVFAELSDEKRPKYQVIFALNKALGIETSFSGNETPLKREVFESKVKPILENKDVQKLYKFKLPENPEDYIIIVNSIYKKWTGKTKVVCHEKKVRVDGKYVTPYVMRETTIGKEQIPIAKYIVPHHSTTHSINTKYKEQEINYDWGELLEMKGKETDEGNEYLIKLMGT